MKKATKKKPHQTEISKPLGSGIFAIFRKGKLRRIEARSLRKLRSLLGDRLLAGLVRGMNASERLDSFVHLIRLNREHVKDGSLANDRNHRLLVFLTFGTLYEAMLALDVLHGAGIRRLVGRECEAWNALDAMRKRWDKDPTLGLMRHKFAHHLGDTDDVIRGMDVIGDAHLVLFKTDGEGKRFDSAQPFAFEIILRGAVTDGEAFIAAATAAVDDHIRFSEGIHHLFGDVLRAAGVKEIEIPA